VVLFTAFVYILPPDCGHLSFDFVHFSTPFFWELPL
jgi:hypothetical protein